MIKFLDTSEYYYHNVIIYSEDLSDMSSTEPTSLSDTNSIESTL